MRTFPGTAAVATYEPAEHYNGTDTFTYVITDNNGDTSTGTITVVVNAVNDPPEGGASRNFAMDENTFLMVDAADGLLRGAFDVEAGYFDEMGNLPSSTISAQLQTLPAVGVLNFNSVDGTFDYTPPLNFTGEVSFTYRLFDDEIFSADPVYTVTIQVNEVVVNVEVPTPGEVSINYNLAQTPLEQSATVPPNIMVLMDDSGSMDFQITAKTENINGGFFLDNDPAASSGVRERSYYYLWNLDNSYSSTSTNGRILATPEALEGNSRTDNNQYGVWRARTHLFNRTYYDPSIRYTPWEGNDEDGDAFTDAVASAVRYDPVDPDSTYSILSNHTYTSDDVPEWDSNGGTEDISVSVYIPHYYTTSATPPLEWNDPHTKVEIRSGSTYVGGANRTDCAVGDGNPFSCTYLQEIQNFANYMQYYRNREFVAKAGLGKVVEQVVDMRIGFETISNTTSEDVAPMNELATEGNKRVLLDTIYSFDSYGGTPLRRLLERGGEILACRQSGSTCPALPEPEGRCQQNFALLFTDGYWNGGTAVSGNRDSDGGGSVFDGGRYADTVDETLADTAMYYYEEDLHPTTDDEVPISSRDFASMPETHPFQDEELMHQHMKTFAISFGVEGTLDVDTIQALPPETNALTAGPSGGELWPDPFDDALFKVDDVFHASLNGRGDYFEAGNPEELQSSIEAAFLEFSQASSSASAVAFNSTSLQNGTLLYRGFYDLRDRTGELRASILADDGTISGEQWEAAEELDNVTNYTSRAIMTYNPASMDGVMFEHSNLEAQQQLVVDEDQVNYLRGDDTNELGMGGDEDLRLRADVGGLLGPIVNSSPVFVGEPRAINRDQAPYPTSDLYSDFKSDVGGRDPVVYVGANDGMLHGFDADTGVEVMAYVPSMIIDASLPFSNKLNEFTSPFYYHNYYVDLSPALNDVYMSPTTLGGKEWVTALVGGLGAGGKGYFALDVTDPNNYDSSGASDVVMWEFTDADDTYPVDINGDPIGGAVGAITDPDGNPVKDLGYATTIPLVQMTNIPDGSTREWAAIFGNGPNSTAGYATLFVLLMEGGHGGWGPNDFVKIPTGYGPALPGEQLEGYPNALGAPTAVDANLDGTVDYVYAGDRRGNMFRFDMTSDDPDDWEAILLFSATYDDGTDDIVQPIVSRPLAIKHPTDTGFIIVFGTGSYSTADDAANNEIQSIYGIWDRLEASPATAASDAKTTRLIEQELTNVVDDSGADPVTRRVLTDNDVSLIPDSGSPGTYGWYVDLDMERATNTLGGSSNPDTSGNAPPDAQFPGERAIRRFIYRNGALITTTVLPASDEFSCSGVRPGSVLILDALSGGDFKEPIVDFNQDGEINEDDLVDRGDGVLSSGGVLFDQDAFDGTLVDPSTIGASGDTDFLFFSGGNDTIAYRIEDIDAGRTGRLSWVELDDAN